MLFEFIIMIRSLIKRKYELYASEYDHSNKNEMPLHKLNISYQFAK